MSIVIRELDQARAPTDALAALLVEVTANGSSVGFMHPLAPARAASGGALPRRRRARGGRIVFGALEGGTLAGTVTLYLACPRTSRTAPRS
jgi:hypothetical protein